jgi:alcohol dehydrogenase (cytochrome c)
MTMMGKVLLLGLLAAFPIALKGQSASGVTYDNVRNAATDPQNWLTYGGNYFSNRHSPLRQLTPANVKGLQQQWMYQSPVPGPWQATPLVVDGVMYISQRPNDVVAMDAKTGRVFWIYRYVPNPKHNACCGSNNRGLAVLGNTIYMGTLDSHLVAIDAMNGGLLWDVQVGDFKNNISITHAPLVMKDKVVVGVAGGDMGARDFIAAYDAQTGKEAWRFYTIPGPGEPGHETWEKCPPNSKTFCDPDAWKKGGGSIWVTGSYDPALNLTYWGVGNAGPDFNADQRPGDNLYTCSVIALDADTGKIKWHFQFTPHDHEDYDSVQVPVLADINWRGAPRKVMMWGNRNGFFYVLDRETGKFLHGSPFVRVNWAKSELDTNGRPVETPVPLGQPTYPGNQGGTNWYSPSFSPRTGLFYLQAWEDYATIRTGRIPLRELEDVLNEGTSIGRYYTGGTSKGYVPGPDGAPIPGAPNLAGLTRGPINTWTAAAGHGTILAIDAQTGLSKWRFEMTDVSSSGILTTATDLLFTGTREGHFVALDARTGAFLWKASLGSQMLSGPMSYQVGGRQYVATISGQALVAFALPETATATR